MLKNLKQIPVKGFIEIENYLLSNPDKMIIHSQKNLSLARFSAPEILHNLITSRCNHAAQRIFISSNDGLIPVRTKLQRYKLFKKERKCVKCGRVGTLMSLEKCSKKRSSTYVFHLYCIENDKAVLMTKDHIIPKSKGGPNTMENYQTMCEYCNRQKGSKLEPVAYEYCNKPKNNKLESVAC